MNFQRLSSARVVIENTFGLLKGRFQNLKKLRFRKMELCISAVEAAVFLHNICVLKNFEDPDFDDSGSDSGSDSEDDHSAIDTVGGSYVIQDLYNQQKTKKAHRTNLKPYLKHSDLFIDEDNFDEDISVSPVEC